jgi:hypothetical protein
MQEDDLQIVRDQVTRFRNAIYSARRDDWKGNMNRFPVECCHHACSLLLLYFGQIGIKGYQTYRGNHPVDGDGQHLWLQKGDVVVDISADQFPGIGERVIVTHDSEWHNALNGKAEAPPTNPDYETDLWEWYREIFGDIEARLAEMPSSAIP